MSLKKKLPLGIVLILALVFIFFYFSAFPFANSITYIQPTNCLKNVCNLDDLKLWANEIGYGVNVYNSEFFTSPLSYVVSGNSVIFVNTQIKKVFDNDLCVLLNNSRACEIFEKSINKTETVTLNAFTSLFSVNDIKMKVIALNLQKNFGDKITVRPRYVIISNVYDPNTLATSEEIKEVERQLCILNEQPTVWATYVSCVDTVLLNNQWTVLTWEVCSRNAGVDIETLDKCVADKGLALAKNEYDLVRQLQLPSSPVLFINNDVYTSSLSYEAIKKTVCLYFKEKPEGC